MSRKIRRVAVCGAGAMGLGIAQVAAQSGASVTVIDTNADVLSAGRARLLASIDKLHERGKTTKREAAALSERLVWSDNLTTVADAELVIEAIVESEEVKQDLFVKLEALVVDEAILATNTSSLSISRLAKPLRRPERFVGMHFFNPAPVMELVEIVSGVATDRRVIETVSSTASAWGKVAVQVADVPGFIVNRVARPFYAEAFAALTEQAAPAQVVDALFRDGAGFRMGPLELTDLIGQDVNFKVARSVFDAYFGRTRFFPQTAQRALVDAGYLGRKAGRGVYRYDQAPDARVLPKGLRAEPISGAKPTFDLVELKGVLIGLSRGRTANDLAVEHDRPVALFDWSNRDGIMGFAASSDEAADVAAGLAVDLGSRVYEIEDRPGLIVMRTLLQIANAAADAVLENVADEDGIDTAMRFGANYPFGPFSWANRVGRELVVDALRAIAEETGEAIYRPSQYWSR